MVNFVVLTVPGRTVKMLVSSTTMQLGALTQELANVIAQLVTVKVPTITVPELSVDLDTIVPCEVLPQSLLAIVGAVPVVIECPPAVRRDLPAMSSNDPGVREPMPTLPSTIIPPFGGVV